MRPTVRYKSAADFVTDEIQRLILNGDLAGGTRIDQVELATQLGVSRHPVRQAIERLGERGFIQVLPHRSAVVADLSVSDMEELYELRLSLETTAIERGWDTLLGDRLTKIETAYEAVRRAEASEDLDEFMLANRAFHLSMYEGCGNRHLERCIVTLFDLSERYQRTALRHAGRIVRSVDDHAHMMDAIHRRDKEALKALIIEHNQGTRNTVRQQIG